MPEQYALYGSLLRGPLLELPFVKLIGGVLLFWIGIKLLSDNGEISGSDKLFAAIRTIIVE